MKSRVKAISEFYLSKGRMPSFSELCSLTGLRSKNAAFKLVKRLKNEGYLDQDEKGKLIPRLINRTIKLLGAVEAGFPSPAEEELIDTLSLDEFLINNPSSTYLLKVSGDSMAGAGILPEDLVLVDCSLEPKNGDIVIAQVDGEWTIKYFEKRDGEVFLIPANSKYDPIKPKEELKIGGVVIAVVRKYR